MTDDDAVSGGQPELVDNGERYEHAEALAWLASRFPRPLRVATGYVNLGGLAELAALEGPAERPVLLLLGAAPAPGLGDETPVHEGLEAGRLFDVTLQRMVAERDFDRFPPSRRLRTLQKVDDLISDDRVQVRRYTPEFLHGKAYLFADDPGTPDPEAGAALVSSANLTSAGLHRNRELGLVHYQPNIVTQAVDWFEELWDVAKDFKDDLRERLFPAIPEYTPQQIFLRMLLEFYGNELPEEPTGDRDGLARFQRDGYRRARRIVEELGGVIYADGVGTGKTYIGVEFVEEYARREGKHVLVIAPAQLRDKTWQRALTRANLPGEVISFQELAEDEQLARADTRRRRQVLKLNKDVYRLIIVDEAHAFRSADTTYYHALNRLLGGAKKDLVLLTATPVNNALWDLYHQIMLFARHEGAFDRPLGIAELRAFFRDAGANNQDLLAPTKLFPLIDSVAVRRDRNFLQRHYPDDTFPDGTPVRFPEPRLDERRYDLDEAYPGAFQRIVDVIDGLTMARYKPSAYLAKNPRVDGGQEAFVGLIRSGMLKRFESSVEAARATAGRMFGMHETLIATCREHGVVPSMESLRDLYASVREDEVTPEAVESVLEDDEGARPADDFTDAFLDDLVRDRDALRTMLTDLDALAERDDPKLTALVELLQACPAKKVAIFTSYGDTARYLRDHLQTEENDRGGREMVSVIGDESDADSRQTLMERFCPTSVTGDADFQPPDGEVDLLLATDVISEGQNLQQAQAVISYDMPWNPQRVVQRNGRVIRLKSEFDEVFLYTLLPVPGELEDLLRLEAKLRSKIRAANASVGMESQVLAAIDSEERAFADLEAFANRLADGDPTLLDEGEGRESGSLAGEEYRARLSRAQEEGQLDDLQNIPWGVGSAFVTRTAREGVTLPVVVFAARDRRGKRHWRGVDAKSVVLDQDLVLLQLADPGIASRVDAQDAVDFEEAWRIAADDICKAHNAELDPASRTPQLLASQRWALELLRDPSLPDQEDFERADAALSVPRDRSVLRALSVIRKKLEAEERTPLDAAQEVTRTVLVVFGLRAPDTSEAPEPYTLTLEDLGVVAYQAVFGAPANGDEEG